ncbi:rhamnulokinase [Trueperella pyogenes]|uniref:rhamnulokinase n=1 Tax=Trueperella pyogenes TaxID=1661 RepID=UPI00339D71C2
MTTVSVVAVDMGSSNVRAVLGMWDGERLERREILRVSHRAIPKSPLAWDVALLRKAAVSALDIATDILGKAPDGVAIDGWGVDCVFVDDDNSPLTPARCYRDAAGARGRARLEALYSEVQLYRETGVLPQDINTCYQIAGDDVPRGTLMFLADHVARSLVSDSVAPWASAGVASTSSLVKADGTWHTDLAKVIGLEANQLPELMPELSVVGYRGTTAVMRAGSHDTACAVHSLCDPQAQFISCGSWAIAGVLTPRAVVTDAAWQAGVTNEAATNGKNRAQINLTGLWVGQECRRAWKERGYNPTYAELDALVGKVPVPEALIDINAPELTTPGAMPEKVALLARRIGVVVDKPEEIMRLLTESLAHAQAKAIRTLRNVTGTQARVYMVGGGTRDRLLVERTAHLLSEPVCIADPEASALGNIIAQLQTLGAEPAHIATWMKTSSVLHEIHQ